MVCRTLKLDKLKLEPIRAEVAQHLPRDDSLFDLILGSIQARNSRVLAVRSSRDEEQIASLKPFHQMENSGGTQTQYA